MWEDLSTIQNQFPNFNLEDKVNSEQGGIVKKKQMQHVDTKTWLQVYYRRRFKNNN